LPLYDIIQPFKMKSSFLCIILFSLYFLSVHGWGEEGHKIVAQIANDMLSSSASNLVVQYIGSQYTLVEIAPWPDKYRETSEGAWSEPCHFVDMPKGSIHFNLQADCPGCCVVVAINNYTNLLTQDVPNPTPCDFDDGVEPCPLEFLVHYVGDAHQPLHVGWADDRGGNDVKVNFFGTSTNLHAVWDTGMIEKWTTSYEDAATELEQFIANNPALVEQFESDTDSSDWADESFQYVRTVCYNYTLQNGVPYLYDDYYNDNLPIVKLRLVAAGVRLGTLLNSVMGSNYKIRSKKIRLNRY